MYKFNLGRNPVQILTFSRYTLKGRSFRLATTDDQTMTNTKLTNATRKSNPNKLPAIPTFTHHVLAAAKQFIARRDRKEHPDGKTDNAKRWYPSTCERTPGCAYIRSPTRAWPWSLMTHCRTAAHVAELHGVDDRDVKRAAGLLDRLASGTLVVRRNSILRKYH